MKKLIASAIFTILLAVLTPAGFAHAQTVDNTKATIIDIQSTVGPNNQSDQSSAVQLQVNNTVPIYRLDALSGQFVTTNRTASAGSHWQTQISVTNSNNQTFYQVAPDTYIWADGSDVNPEFTLYVELPA